MHQYVLRKIHTRNESPSTLIMQISVQSVYCGKIYLEGQLYFLKQLNIYLFEKSKHALNLHYFNILDWNGRALKHIELNHLTNDHIFFTLL